MTGFFLSGIILILFSFYRFSPSVSYRIRNIAGIGICCVLMAAGMYRTEQVSHFPSVGETADCKALIRIKQKPVAQKNTLRSSGILISRSDSNGHKSCATPLLLYFPKDSATERLSEGDWVACSLHLRKIENSGNPDEFDFKRYMHHKGIDHSASVRDFRKISYPPLHNSSIVEKRWMQLKNKGDRLRNKISDRLRLSIENEKHRAFLAAILIGDKSDITSDTRNDFARSGLSHILAVSGLHTGILFMLAMLLLMPLRLIGFRRTTYLITIVIMWGYAFITGFPPSVIRAVCMITILLIARILRDDNHAMNALFITAFIMLLINPYYLFDVGFQLSFLAVLSILIYYPMLRKRFSFSNPLLNGGLNILYISLSAQILVLPLSIYYFHIVPLWFLPANLLIIPLLSPLVSLGILEICCGFCGLDIHFLQQLLNDGVGLIFSIGRFFSSLPGEHFYYPSQTEVVILFLLIALFTAFLLHRKAALLISGLSATLLLLSISLFSVNERPAEVILFNQRESNLLHYFTKSEHLIYTNDSLFCPEAIEGVYKPYALRRRSGNPQRIDDLSDRGDTDIRNPFIRIGDKHFCMITDNRFRRYSAEKRPDVNYMFIGGKYAGDISRLQEIAGFNQVVLLPTLGRFRTDRLKAQCDSLEIPVYEISRNGAFRLIIK